MKNQVKERPTSKNKTIPVKNLPSGSTKAASSLIDQGFLFQGLIAPKGKNSQNKNNPIKQKKNNLYDLQRTLDINIEILKTFFKNTTSTMTLLNQDKIILDKLDAFIAKYNKKKEIIHKIKEIKSKNLIQMQIFFECKRKLQETLNNCKESLLDNEDAVNNKDEYVKLFQKKFVEVEIYLQRITADMENKQKKKRYQNYKMETFTNLNTTLNKKKETLMEDIEKYKKEKKKLKSENKIIKKEEKKIMAEEIKREEKREKEDQLIKKKNELNEKKYKELIKKKVTKVNLLKNFMNNNCNIDLLINGNANNINNKSNYKEKELENDEDIKEGENNKNKINMFKKVEVKKNKNNERKYVSKNNIIKEEDENERSLLPFDMTKRMNSFMDFSAVLNDNSNIKESVNRKNISKIWGNDVSAIEKNDDI
jgi:hypothetical protein